MDYLCQLRNQVLLTVLYQRALLLLLPLLTITSVSVSNGQFIRFQNGVHFHHGERQKPTPRAKLRTDLVWIHENLARHNYYRELHGAPPLVLNHTLCEISQAWANQRARGRPGHNPDRGWLGENIYTIGVFGAPLQVNGSHPVDLWYEEIKDYDYGTCRSVNTEPIGHFTQVVWHGGREMGVAAAFYRTGHWDNMVVVANYYPPGNAPGFYSENVQPRISGAIRALQTGNFTDLLLPFLVLVLYLEVHATTFDF